jgi:phosphohistidine phosphatase
MLLALLRHGIAEDAGPRTGGRDEPRRLTDAGIRRMRAAARGMTALGLAPSMVVTSPLRRCVETAEIVASALGAEVLRDERVAPGMTVDDIADLIAMHGSEGELMVCGHQPDLSRAVAELTGGSSVEMRKGSLALMELRSARPNGGHLVGLYPPRALRALGTGERHPAAGAPDD